MFVFVFVLFLFWFSLTPCEGSAFSSVPPCSSSSPPRRLGCQPPAADVSDGLSPPFCHLPFAFCLLPLPFVSCLLHMSLAFCPLPFAFCICLLSFPVCVRLFSFAFCLLQLVLLSFAFSHLPWVGGYDEVKLVIMYKKDKFFWARRQISNLGPGGPDSGKPRTQRCRITAAEDLGADPMGRGPVLPEAVAPRLTTPAAG